MEFNYFSQNFLDFEKAFHAHWVGEIPLTYLTDDLLKSMKPHRPYFQMPPQQCVDGQRKWFVFEVDGEKYKFVGVYNRSPLIKKGQKRGNNN